MLIAAAVGAIGAIIVLVASRDEEVGAGNPTSKLTLEEAQTPLKNGPRAVRRLRTDANVLLDGGPTAFQARLDSLAGTPVVVNLWASWCGPCRFEFPFFQSQAIEHEGDVAFIGVDVAESSDAAAETFLEELPLPYPSYSDPGTGVADAEIVRSLDAGPGLPNTIFFDEDGEVAYHWRGGYESEAQLADQIDRYASE